jgi:hypothetical protein
MCSIHKAVMAPSSIRLSHPENSFSCLVHTKNHKFIILHNNSLQKTFYQTSYIHGDVDQELKKKKKTKSKSNKSRNYQLDQSILLLKEASNTE